LTFEIGGAKFTLEPEYYLLDTDWSPAGRGCEILFAANNVAPSVAPNAGYIIGAPFFRKFAPSFDIGNNEFGLIAPTGSFDCPSGGSGKC